MDQLYAALNSIKVLRSNVGKVFDSLSNGLRADHGEESKENKFILELQELLTTVNNNLRDVEQSVGNLTPPPGPFPLGNTAYLSQETTQERQALYSQLVNSYKWTDKPISRKVKITQHVNHTSGQETKKLATEDENFSKYIHEYSSLATSLLSQNSLKRSYIASSSGKRRRTQTSIHNVPPEVIDNMITSIDRMYTDMTVSAPRPFVPNPVLQITLARVLKAVVAFKGFMIEWVVVKGYGESWDLWTESRHKVFRKVTENSHAAMLHFFSPTMPELAVKSFMTWLHSFVTLFSSPCKKCGNHLHGNLPPTWRDLRTLDPFHEECK